MSQQADPMSMSKKPNLILPVGTLNLSSAPEAGLWQTDEGEARCRQPPDMRDTRERHYHDHVTANYGE